MTKRLIDKDELLESIKANGLAGLLDEPMYRVIKNENGSTGIDKRSNTLRQVIENMPEIILKDVRL